MNILGVVNAYGTGSLEGQDMTSSDSALLLDSQFCVVESAVPRRVKVVTNTGIQLLVWFCAVKTTFHC